MSSMGWGDATRHMPVQGIEAMANGARLLIADDSDDSRFLLEAYLEGSPYKITFVENGEEAVLRVRSLPYDLILMDIQMPVVDGLAATRMIRQREKEERKPTIPIVALTAHGRTEDIDLCKQAGCSGHLNKPIEKSKLLSTLKEYLSKPDDGIASTFEVDVPPGFEAAAKRYIQSRKNEVPRLRQLVAEQNFEEVRVLAHNMKGTGTPYGYPNLTEWGRLLEQSAKDRNSAALSEQLAYVARYIEHAIEVVALLPA